MKAVAYHKAQFQEQVERVIQRCPADTKLKLVRQFLSQLVQREVPIDAIYRIKYRITLLRLTMVVHFQIAVKYPPDGGFHTIIHCQLLHKPHKGTTFSSDKRQYKL